MGRMKVLFKHTGYYKAWSSVLCLEHAAVFSHIRAGGRAAEFIGSKHLFLLVVHILRETCLNHTHVSRTPLVCQIPSDVFCAWAH